MRIYDLHQDIVLSYEDCPQQFINFEVASYIDKHHTNAWSLQDYLTADLSSVFGAIRPFTLEWELADKKHRKISYSQEKLQQYLEIYQTREQQGHITIVREQCNMSTDSKLQIVLHIEWMDAQISVDELHTYYAQWVRSLWFVRNFDNHLAHCNLSEQWGLTELGREIIFHMNQLGMILDTAHMNHASMMESLKISKKPVINSHSNLLSYTQHPRNVSDEFLYALAENWWVLWLSICRNFLWETYTSIEWYLAQIAYVRKCIWDDHIAFGTDYHWLTKDNMLTACNHVGKVEVLVAAVTQQFGEAFAEKFFSANSERILKAHLQ